MALGDIIYRGASLWLRLVGNTEVRRKVLSQVGTGSVSAAPSWSLMSTFEVEVALSSSDILNLRATPKTLVAAPGTAFVLEFISIVLLLDATATAYVETNDNLAVRYQNTTGALVSEAIEATGFIDQTADTMTTGRPKLDQIVAATGCANQPLVLHNTGDGEYTTGTGVIRAKVAYRVWPTGW